MTDKLSSVCANCKHISYEDVTYNGKKVNPYCKLGAFSYEVCEVGYIDETYVCDKFSSKYTNTKG